MNIEELVKELEALKKESENTTDKLTLLIKRIKEENINEVSLDLKTRQAIQDAVRKEIEKQNNRYTGITVGQPRVNPLDPIKPDYPWQGPLGPLVTYDRPDQGMGLNKGIPCDCYGRRIYGVSPLNPPPLGSLDDNRPVRPIPEDTSNDKWTTHMTDVDGEIKPTYIKEEEIN